MPILNPLISVHNSFSFFCFDYLFKTVSLQDTLFLRQVPRESQARKDRRCDEYKNIGRPMSFFFSKKLNAIQER